jgi:hypothetical protein
VAIIALLALCAAAPAPDSDDYADLHPYSKWIEAQKNEAIGSCCSLADGRVVDWRITGDHYEVRFLHPESIQGQVQPEAGHWYAVDDRAVLHTPNPTGKAVAWWYARTGYGPIRCFSPAEFY